MVAERQPDVKTLLKRSESYWGEIESNVTEGIFRPVSQDATRVAALISGELDLVWPVAVQDWQRLEGAEGVRALTGPEARTVFLGFDQARDELLYSNVKGKNPFHDVKVREAFARAIDVEAIKEKIMRGASQPTGLMVAPQINGFSKELNDRWEHEADMAQQLLAEAGYPDGFEVTMDCPNDRYVNDDAIAQAIAQMWARIGVRATVQTMPASMFFSRGVRDEYSISLTGWSSTTGEADTPLATQIATPDPPRGRSTVIRKSHYANPEVDAIIDRAFVAIDVAERERLYREFQQWQQKQQQQRQGQQR
jgi:peptide/nickel transport system substrate-binding protein